MDGNFKKLIRFLIVLAAAVLITWCWNAIKHKVGMSLFLSGYTNILYVPIATAASTAFLLLVVWFYHRWIAPLGLGNAFQRKSILPALAILAISLTDMVYTHLMGYEYDKWLTGAFELPIWLLLFVMLSAFVLLPLGQEIIYRGICLNVFRTSKPWTIWAGTIILTIVFYRPTWTVDTLFLFVESCLFALTFTWARIMSGGLLLPVLLHIFAAVLGASLIHLF